MRQFMLRQLYTKKLYFLKDMLPNNVEFLGEDPGSANKNRETISNHLSLGNNIIVGNIMININIFVENIIIFQLQVYTYFFTGYKLLVIELVKP